MSSEYAAAVEVRMAGRTLRGVALRYGERSLERAELFEPGAFAPLGEVSLNLQHDRLREIASTRAGTLRVSDTPEALRIEAGIAGRFRRVVVSSEAYPSRSKCRVSAAHRAAIRRPTGDREGHASGYRPS